MTLNNTLDETPYWLDPRPFSHSYEGQALPQRADVLVIGGGYTGKLIPWFHRRIIPVESFMIATEPLPADLAHSLVPQNRMVFDSKNFLYYFRLSPDGTRMLFGGRPKSMHVTHSEKAEPLLQAL